MATKPITNQDTLNKSEINRADQTSFRSEKGNAKVVIRKTGGKDAGKGYSIKLKDVDTAVLKHMMVNILSLIHISEPTRPERIWFCRVWMIKIN